jgi:hypothetical protein
MTVRFVDAGDDRGRERAGDTQHVPDAVSHALHG